MRAIQATPKEVRKIFSDSYIIPDFQRPYSWDIDQCETLWDDFISFLEKNTGNQEEKYFLGNIVIHPASDRRFAVIDGQQRLTTMLLLMKALSDRARTYKALEPCLRTRHYQTGELTDELRISTDVIEKDRETLSDIVFDRPIDKSKSKLAENFRLFINKIDDWLKDHTADEFTILIDTLLDKIVLLPIECGSADDALTIFQTINNRGMSLSDADIFKAMLYKEVPEQQKQGFIDTWKELSDPDWLFRVYMHILRAEKGDITKEIGLRAFFAQRETLSDWANVIASLEKIHAITTGDLGDEKKWSKPYSLWGILETYPNQYWKYTMYVFLHKYGTFDEAVGFTIDDKKTKELTVLLEEMVRFYFIKGVVYNAVNTVKDTTFKVCTKIANSGDYLAEYRNGLTTNDKIEMSSRLSTNKIGRNYQRGLVLLASYLNSAQDT